MDLQQATELKESTAGMMKAENYLELYRIALHATGNVIDIGTGQGATTIAYALGLRDSGREAQVHAIDQFFQVARGPHRYNKLDYPDDCVERNVSVYNDHLRRIGVADLVITHVGTTDEVAARFPDIRCGVLSIDVDGHIDRDLGHFYDLVVPGGTIVIDDCKDTIVSTGRENIAKMAGKAESEIRAWIGRQSTWNTRRLLGKHLLAFRVAESLVADGFLQPQQVIGNTAVFSKASDQPFARFDMSRMEDVERSIVEDFSKKCLT